MAICSSVRRAMAVLVATLALQAGPAWATLVDHYEFENNGVDSAGGDANGVVGANVAFSAGVIGNAVTPTRSISAADTIVVANGFDPGSGDFTIAHWVQRNNPADNVFEQTMDALSGTGEGYQSFFLDNGFGNQFRFRLDDGAGNFALVDSVATFTDTQFHHVALVVDRTANTATYYVDGVAETPLDMSGLPGAISPDQNLVIGNVDGNIDDLRFYNNALTAGDVAALVPEPVSMTYVLINTIALAGFATRRSSQLRR